MTFKSMEHLNLWLRNNMCNFLNQGAQGVCYKISNKVYKFFLEFVYDFAEGFSIYNKEDLLIFKEIANNTYVFPDDVIMVGDIVVGYIYDYVLGSELHGINPLRISLDKFDRNLEIVSKDIKIISDFGVATYDVMYNILYGNKGFFVIDTLEYSLTDRDREELYRMNVRNFDYAIKLFLTYDYFDKFLDSNSFLREMYDSFSVSAIEFLRELRYRLSENEGYEIKKLGDAKDSIQYTRRRDLKYIRSYRTFVD